MMTGRTRRAGLLTVLVAAMAGCTVTAAPAATGPTATTDVGRVRGVDHGDHVTYSGVPYAAAPVGALRWRDPRPVTPWTGVRDADRPGPACAQPNPSGNGFLGSEDCLFLNVTAPSRLGTRRPVLVWLHGGAGTGQGSDYDPGRMAARGDAVVVTVNYRLGVFSFFGHPELHGAGDFGYADQRAALRWVRRNAAAFGGDPRNVTLFGESSGALSACSQLASPDAKGLFDKVILQSGSCLLRIPRNGVAPGVPVYDQWVPRDQAETRGTQLARSSGCAVSGREVDCLRRASTAALATPTNTQNLGYTSYGIPSLPTRPAHALTTGQVIRVPVLLGTNRDEMRFFVSTALAAGFTLDQNTYRRLLTDTFGPAAPRVEATYPASSYPTPALAWARVQTDAGFACTGLSAAQAFSAHVPTYSYEFADEHAPDTAGGVQVPGFPVGAGHTLEFASLFDFPAVHLTEPQQALSNQMIDYWIRFARDGDPNGPDTPHWPRFTPTDQQTLVLDSANVQTTNDFATAHRCNLWTPETTARSH